MNGVNDPSPAGVQRSHCFRKLKNQAERFLRKGMSCRHKIGTIYCLRFSAPLLRVFCATSTGFCASGLLAKKRNSLKLQYILLEPLTLHKNCWPFQNRRLCTGFAPMERSAAHTKEGSLVRLRHVQVFEGFWVMSRVCRFVAQSDLDNRKRQDIYTCHRSSRRQRDKPILK